MKKRLWPLLATSACLSAIALPSENAGAAPTAPDVSFATREQTASPAIRSTLLQLRQEIATKRLTHTVGYTTALDRPLSQLTGLVVPADIKVQAARQATVQQQLLQADLSMKAAYDKLHHTTQPPPELTPNFTATSPRADWRALGAVTPIRNQGGCGSCWAFAAMGAYEASYMIRNRSAPDTSEQGMLSCSGAGSCAGGWTAPALSWLVSNGTDTEMEYPYTATSGNCHTFSPNYLAAAWGYIQPNGTIPSNAEMKQAIVTYGPIIVALYATPQFQAYTGGVFYQAVPAGALNHGVVLVGWDDTKVGPNGARGAWILRNSWGTGWGTTADQGTERGYMYLAYNSSNVGIWSQWVRAPRTSYGTSPLAREFILKSQTLTPVLR